MRWIIPSYRSRAGRAPGNVNRAPVHASQAPVHASRAPGNASRAPGNASRAPAHVSRAPVHASRAPGNAEKASWKKKMAALLAREIEAGEVSATLRTMANLANALGIDPSALLAPKAHTNREP